MTEEFEEWFEEYERRQNIFATDKEKMFKAWQAARAPKYTDDEICDILLNNTPANCMFADAPREITTALRDAGVIQVKD